MSCMICSKIDGVLFKVGSKNGQISHTVGEDFVEIYGEKVREYLTPESCVCNSCKNSLEHIAKLIRCIWSLISDPYTKPQSNKVSKFWNFLSSLKLDEYSFENIQPHDSTSRIPTPNLVYNSFCVPYNGPLEQQIAEEERFKSLYRARPGTDTSEVNTILNQDEGRRNDRGSRSLTSSGYGRSKDCRELRTSHSDFSLESVGFSSSLAGRLHTSRTLTRSISRALAEEEKQEQRLPEMLIKCTEKPCDKFSYDIDEMNAHNIEKHEMPITHNCFLCFNGYTLESLFNMHMNQHDFFCLMCGVEQQNVDNLQKHLDEHMIYSVPCKYCDKSFLSKLIRERHINKHHKGRRKRRIYRKNLILMKIEKDESKVLTPVPLQKDYEARILLQTDMAFEDGDVDMTIENLEMKNVDVFTDVTRDVAQEELDNNIDSLHTEIEISDDDIIEDT